jgi:hypothetical protein
MAVSSRPAILVLTFRAVIEVFEAALSSQPLVGGSRQPVTLARSLPAGGLDASRRARWSRSSRRRRVGETADAIFQQVGVEIRQHLPSPLRVLREHRVLRDSCSPPTRANGAIFPVNIHQALNTRSNSYGDRTLGPLPWPGMPANNHFPVGPILTNTPATAASRRLPSTPASEHLIVPPYAG